MVRAPVFLFTLLLGSFLAVADCEESTRSNSDSKCSDTCIREQVPDTSVLLQSAVGMHVQEEVGRTDAGTGLDVDGAGKEDDDDEREYLTSEAEEKGKRRSAQDEGESGEDEYFVKSGESTVLDEAIVVALTGGKQGKYCTDIGKKIMCNKDSIGSSELFTLENAGAGKTTLKGGKQSKYCADQGTIRCNRDGISKWERFSIQEAGFGKIALRGGRQGKYCADVGTGGKIMCTSETISESEKFGVECISGCPANMGVVETLKTLKVHELARATPAPTVPTVPTVDVGFSTFYRMKCTGEGRTTCENSRKKSCKDRCNADPDCAGYSDSQGNWGRGGWLFTKRDFRGSLTSICSPTSHKHGGWTTYLKTELTGLPENDESPDAVLAPEKVHWLPLKGKMNNNELFMDGFKATCDNFQKWQVDLGDDHDITRVRVTAGTNLDISVFVNNNLCAGYWQRDNNPGSQLDESVAARISKSAWKDRMQIPEEGKYSDRTKMYPKMRALPPWRSSWTKDGPPVQIKEFSTQTIDCQAAGTIIEIIANKGIYETHMCEVEVEGKLRKVKKSGHGDAGSPLADAFTCPTTAALTTQSMTSHDYSSITAAVHKLYHQLDDECTVHRCPQADFAGCVVRLVGHDFMDFKPGEGGGADACTDLDDPDNHGLRDCIQHGEHGKSLQEAYSSFCNRISLADFLVISAEAVMKVSRQRVIQQDPHAPTIDFAQHFRYGRTTSRICSRTLHRLPDAERGCAANRETFIENMGMDWHLTTALMAVHTLGRAQIKNSGYNGRWGDATNSRLFNNHYYHSLLTKGWAPQRAVGGNPHKNQWIETSGDSCRRNPIAGYCCGPHAVASNPRIRAEADSITWSDSARQRFMGGKAGGFCTCKDGMSYISSSGERKKEFLIAQPERCLPDNVQEDLKEDQAFMLDTDMCLIYQGADAETQPMCCNWLLAWDMPKSFYDNENHTHCGQPPPFCGGKCEKIQRRRCCEGALAPQELKDKLRVGPAAGLREQTDRPQFYDCTTKVSHGKKGPGFQAARQFANDEGFWLETFLFAWQKATNNGFDNLKCVNGGSCSATMPNRLPKGFHKFNGKKLPEMKGHNGFKHFVGKDNLYGDFPFRSYFADGCPMNVGFERCTGNMTCK